MQTVPASIDYRLAICVTLVADGCVLRVMRTSQLPTGGVALALISSVLVSLGPLSPASASDAAASADPLCGSPSPYLPEPPDALACEEEVHHSGSEYVDVFDMRGTTRCHITWDFWWRKKRPVFFVRFRGEAEFNCNGPIMLCSLHAAVATGYPHLVVGVGGGEGTWCRVRTTEAVAGLRPSPYVYGASFMTPSGGTVATTPKTGWVT